MVGSQCDRSNLKRKTKYFLAPINRFTQNNSRNWEDLCLRGLLGCAWWREGSARHRASARSFRRCRSDTATAWRARTTPMTSARRPDRPSLQTRYPNKPKYRESSQLKEGRTWKYPDCDGETWRRQRGGIHLSRSSLAIRRDNARKHDPTTTAQHRDRREDEADTTRGCHLMQTRYTLKQSSAE